MFPLVLPLALVIGGGVAYHLALRAAAAASPWAILTPAYGLAFLVCGGLWWRSGRAAAVLPGSALAVAAVLAVALIAIEGGYLWAYRSGVAMSHATALTNTAVIAALAVLGVVVLGESLTASRGLGLAIAAAGVWLVTRG
jgi:drug/metabolite transporter (DMT)-like permease